MALTTTYIVVPFLAGARGRLHPGTPRQSLSRANAIALADGLAPSYAGVIVLRDRDDPSNNVYLEPLPISAAGKVLKHVLREPYWRGRDRNVA